MIVALAGAAGLVALVLSALPYLASTRIVHDRIAVEMSDWTGYEVDIGAPPQLDIWPRLRAVLTDVTLSRGHGADQRPVLLAGRVDVTLSALAALRGEAVFTSIDVVEPEIRIGGQGSEARPALPDDGRVVEAIAAARRAVRDDAGAPLSGALSREPFGTIRVTNGRLVADGPKGPVDVATNVEGKIDWKAMDQPGSLTGSAMWRGETVSVDLRSSNPLLLLAGGKADLAISLQSQESTFSFDGTVRYSDETFVDGRAAFKSPSLSRLAAWIGADLPSGSDIGAASLASTVSGTHRHIKLDKAEIDIDGSLGRGAIELALAGKTPRLSGSLAFETLDIVSLLDALVPLVSAGNEPESRGATSPAVGLDLRLSAARASAGAIELSAVAATAQIRDGLAAFDISDATAFGGTVQAGLRFDRQATGQTVGLRLLASDIDGGPFGAAIGMTRLAPVGKGTVSVILKGPGEELDDMLAQANGSVSASFKNGLLRGFDLDRFLARTAEGGFFSLADVAQADLAFDALDLEASIARGVASITRGEARFGQRRIALSGVVPYVGRGLALSGEVGTTAAGAGGTEAEFFVGGSWDAPFIAPNMPEPEFE